MNCPSCGADIPEGMVFCSMCGTQIPLSQPQPQPQQTYNVNDALFGGAQSGGYGSPYGAQTSPIQPAKKKTGGVVAAIIAIVVIAAAVFAVGFFVLGWRYNGTYKFTKVEVFGMSYTLEDFQKETGNYNYNVSLKMSFGKATINASDLGYSGTARATFKGNKITFKDGSDTFEGEYIPSEKAITIVIPYNGVSMTLYFQK